MSLVAYGYESSGESDVEDDRVPETELVAPSASTPNIELGRQYEYEKEFTISDEETDIINLSVSHQQPKSHSETDVTHEKKMGMFSLLPKPKKKYVIPEEDVDHLVKAGNVNVDTEVLSLSVNKTAIVERDQVQEDVGKKLSCGFLSLPKPKFSSSASGAEQFGHQEKKHPVQITIPSLPDVDSDDEEDSNSKKASRLAPSKKGSNLLGLLPKPRNSITFGVINKNKPMEKKSNRKLVPYTLSKKKEEKATDNKNIKLLGPEYDAPSDEDEPISFFSLDSKSKSVSQSSVLPNKAEVTIEKDIPYAIPETNNSTSRTETSSFSEQSSDLFASFPSIVISGSNKTNMETITSQDPSYLLNQKNKRNATETESIKFDVYSKLVNKLSSSKSKNESPALPHQGHSTNTIADAYSSVTGPYNVTENVTGPYDYDVVGPYENNSIVGPYPETDISNKMEPYTNKLGYSSMYGRQGPSEYVPQDYQIDPSLNEEWNPQETSNSEQIPLDEDALTKLHGKRKHRKEEINIIDISGDQFQRNSKDLLKTYTEESAHQSKKNKSEMPSHLAKRRHQITYLAFQAKEKELELRNNWSTNRHSRKQTQSKYGF